MGNLRKLHPGEIFESNNYGKFKILAEIKEVFDETGLHPADYKVDKYIVQFLDTGYINFVSVTTILKGEVKDRSMPFVCGVGYMGANIRIQDEQYADDYKHWNNMLSRCYNPNNREYKNYGAIGISVVPRWHSFWNYWRDLKYLPNYDKKMMFPKEYQIDKDILQLNIPTSQRIYSPETCMFVSLFDNLQIRNKEASKNLYGNRYFGVGYPRTDKRVETSNRKHTRVDTFKTRITLYDPITHKTIDSKDVATFTNDVAAASLYNYIYPFLTKDIPYHQINLLNRIENPIPYNELPKYLANTYNIKNNWFNDYPTWEYIASAMEAAGDRFTYIYW